MLNLKIYLIIGIVFALLVSGFYAYYRISEAEKAVLIANNAKLEDAIRSQEEAIKSLREHSERLAKANVDLTRSYTESETRAALARTEIDNTDYDKVPIQKLEKKINEDFIHSLRALNPNRLYIDTESIGNK